MKTPLLPVFAGTAACSLGGAAVFLAAGGIYPGHTPSDLLWTVTGLSFPGSFLCAGLLTRILIARPRRPSLLPSGMILGVAMTGLHAVALAAFFTEARFGHVVPVNLAVFLIAAFVGGLALGLGCAWSLLRHEEL
ncbi:MAG TPA: hypothetical protein VF950_03635 [Planctomycetota bacterium]